MGKVILVIFEYLVRILKPTSGQIYCMLIIIEPYFNQDHRKDASKYLHNSAADKDCKIDRVSYWK